MNKIINYRNGNTIVNIYDNGTKERFVPVDIPIKVEFPESLDVKITNKCNANCSYCHEKSNDLGEHANTLNLLSKLNELPKGVELALGGGNLLEHPDVVEILEELHKKFIPNITINQMHDSDKLLPSLLKNIYGLGYSVIATNRVKRIHDHQVLHLILGIHSIDDIIYLTQKHKERFNKILLLGYKTFGRGVEYKKNHLGNITENIKALIDNFDKISEIPNLTISFDNLALEQLNLINRFSSEYWKSHYMGDEFTFSMYFDAVNMEYAPNSRSNDRTSAKDLSIIQYFKTNRTEQTFN